MNEITKLTWLKRVLIIKILVVVFFWGLPSLLGTPGILKFFNVTLPEDPFYFRMIGAIQLALALLYWFAYKNPVRNRDIIKFAIVDNALSTLTILGVALTTGVPGMTIWITAVLTAFFTVAFAVLLPKDES